jgi:hypothetical protein
MASAINIVLNAVDEYSSTLTGLNQGLELLSKGFGLVKDAASFAFDTIGKGVELARIGVELARIGGAFDEQRNQFENLANSYRLNGQQISDTGQNISSNTVTELEAVKIATKAVAVGLQGPDLQNALTYAKKWSEATGESFESAAERITTALGAGRFGVLRQMGLIVEKGATTEQVLKSISAGLQHFGDTGFNAADKLDSLNVAQEDFTRKIGQGINQSKEFQSVLGTMADALFNLVKGFNPAPVTVFIDLLVGGAKKIGSAFLTAFPSVNEALDVLFNDTKQSVTDLTKFMIDASFGTVRQIASAINTVVDLVRGLNIGNVFSKAAQSIALIVGTLIEGIAKSVSFVIDYTLKGFDNLVLGLAATIRKFPNIADALGIDAAEVEGLADSFNKIRAGITGGLDGIGNLAFDAGKNIALALDGFNSSADKYKISLDAIDKAQANAKKSAEDLLKGGALAGGEIKVSVPESELEKLRAFKAELAADVNLKLDDGKGGDGKKDTDTLDENSILAALVILLKNALSGAAASEGTPLAVTS